MSLTAARLISDLDQLKMIEPAFKNALKSAGYPQPRIRPRGYQTLLRTIIGQQVSVHAANAIWGRLEASLGESMQPATLLASTDDALRAIGLSRQKISYARSLAEHIDQGLLDLDQLDTDDDIAIAQLTRVKGIGRWSAEIYLLFAEERPDIWPAGDLAVQIELGRMLKLSAKPSEKETRLIAEKWRPYRGAAAIMFWHLYQTAVL